MSNAESTQSPRSSGRRLTASERAALLARGLTGHLACLDGDGHPYVVPIWFTYVDGGFYVAARARSTWGRYLARDGRVSLCIDGGPDDPAGARVLVKGVAESVESVGTEGRWVDIAREMSVRYMGEAEGLAYFTSTRAEPRRLFFVRPTHVSDWAGGWAGKYKHSNW